jgi:hypothetical protein
LVVGAAVATHSVVRYLLWIVLTYTVLAVVLAVGIAGERGRDAGSPLANRWVAGVCLLLTGLAVLGVRSYTYLRPEDALTVRRVLAGTAVVAAVAVLVPGRRYVTRLTTRLLPRRRAAIAVRCPHGHDLALGVAVVGYLATAVALIRLDPAPKIDVWVTLQQASDALWRGDNFYATNWTGSPGVQDAFTYLPWMAVLLSPGRMLFGDVRWMLVAFTVLTVVAVRALGSVPTAPPVPGAPGTAPGTPETPPAPRADRNRRAAAVAAAMILLLPGTPALVEQAWTEPLLLACLAGWALALTHGRTRLAVVALALGLASKQHLAMVLPLLAVWPGFGWRRTAASAGLAGTLVLPWFLASPADLWHDTVDLLVHFPPLEFADTLYIAAIQELDWTPPFALTGGIVLGTLTVATLTIRRRDPGLPQVLRWCALVLFVANLVNKQAFYNQYWLVMTLVLLSWAVPTSPAAAPPTSPDVTGHRTTSRGPVDAHPVRS